MGERHKLRLRFQGKVLIPVVTVMALFLGATLWVGNNRIQRQLQSSNNQSLTDAQALFTNAFESRADYLMRQFGPKTEEASFGYMVKKLERSSAGDTDTAVKTIVAGFGDIMASTPVEGTEVLLFTDPSGQLLAQTNRAPGLTSAQFLAACSNVVQSAIKAGQPDVCRVEAGGWLFDATAVPAYDSIDKSLLGVLLAGVDLGNSAARTLSPNGQIALIAGDKIAATTLPEAGAGATLATLLNEYRQLARSRSRDFGLVVQGEHYAALAGSLPGFAGPGAAGYLLLSSYEQQWLSFRQAQRGLVLFSLISLAVSTIVVWLVVRRVTEPVRQLRDSAEAIGRGDFSRRVPIQSNDELGELASVFNQTTENLQKSTTQLEKTVEILRATQAQLMHSEKLSAVGEFVAGVAHELNNPLTSLIGFSELVQMSDVDDETRSSLKRINTSAERCHKIVQSLLSFARQHPPERKLTSLNALVDSVVEILIYELRTSNIQVVKELASNLPRLLADPHQLQQVFLNIVNNARQAIEACRPKGSIRITTRALGQRAQIRFQDDGPGISEENLAKIFNPFFTTKPVGKGTGLGLSLSYGIIQEHGGSITAESQPGHGTTFIIELPITTSGEGAGQEPAEAAPLIQGQGQKILVVDDEEDIIGLTVRILEHLGYRVQTASDGEAALRQLAKERFDLVISDWKMPGLGGEELYERLLKADPASAKRIMFMTGDILSDKMQKYLSAHGKLCIAKPFSVAQLQRVIGEMLQSGPVKN
ncbi:MAG TPA: hybrid sensor histidine kinase/response regulator [Verrucomicrobiae bacterium]|jgi:signal transduction histidine kinase